MSILAERIHSLCEQLKLDAVATDWPTLTQSAAQDEKPYASPSELHSGLPAWRTKHNATNLNQAEQTYQKP